MLGKQQGFSPLVDYSLEHGLVVMLGKQHSLEHGLVVMLGKQQGFSPLVDYSLEHGLSAYNPYLLILL
jgi:hypothetical protein